MNFPDKNEYIEFYKFITDTDNEYARNNARMYYRNAVKKFLSVEELLSAKYYDERLESLDTVIIFLCLKYKSKIGEVIKSIRINNAKRIINYFNDNDRFMQVCEEKINKNPYFERYLYTLIVKMLMLSGKNKVENIITEDILKLDTNTFHKDPTIRKQFIEKIDNILGVYHGKATSETISIRKFRKTDMEKYGTGHPFIVIKIEEYLEKEYELKGYQTINPIKALKSFFQWLYENYNDCVDVSFITIEHWLKYKEYVDESNYKVRTKHGKISGMIMFFKWLQSKRYIRNKIVMFDEKTGIRVEAIQKDTKPRMHKNREYYKKIISKVIALQPENERQFLLKHLILVVSATGLRLNEALWLGPGCITDIKDNVGEIIVQINEKLNIKNKPTSILPWGIQSIKYLEERFNNRPTIEFYNEKTKSYFPSLFEYEGKIFSINVASADFNKILREIEVEDEKIIFESGALYHAFRHQKFSDIYDVTDGSLIAVKMDSSHITLGMAKRYTQQVREKKKLEALKFLEEGKIVGKRAEILRILIDSPYPPDKYVEIVSKMNISNNITKEGLKRAMKYLGFGFCSAKECKLAPMCEECDFFWTCKSFESELMERYALNFIMVKSRINEIIANSESEDLTLISSLKYQEKWLYEIGVSEEQIYGLRVKYLEDN